MSRSQDGRIIPDAVLNAPNGGGGTTPFTLISAASTNLTLVKAAPVASLGNPGSGGVRLFMMEEYNANVALRYLKVFDAASVAAVTLGTTVPKLNITLPIALSKVVNFGDIGCQFVNGIVIALTGGQALLDATAISAGDIALNLTVD